MSEIKPGDKVKVKWVDEQDVYRGVSKGDCFEVLRADGDGDIRVNMPNGERGVLFKRQVELVENKTEFTFPEMAQKLIDGEFEVGTEIIATDEDGDEIQYHVMKNMYGYGIDSVASWKNPGVPSRMNATWKVKEQSVKEQPVKEMSIEEIQKELGYKIKVTE